MWPLASTGRSASRRCTRRFVDLSSSMEHTCAVEVGGAVVLGKERDGQLGDGDPVPRARRRCASRGEGATRVFAGYTHTCARAVDGSLRCWGANPHGELGDGSTAAVQAEAVTARGVSGTAAMAIWRRSSRARPTRAARRSAGARTSGADWETAARGAGRPWRPRTSTA
ncbi:MAG: RCC1 domain-containing protein [Polyangiales bacterium]